MPYADLREFVTALDSSGQLRRVEGAELDLEIGTITEVNYERQGPALLFDNIPGYPSGYRILTNALDTLPRALLALDLPPELELDAALAAYDQRLASYRPIPPLEVATGPIFDNSCFEDGIDLEKFPAPLWHEADGGRYLGTGCMVVMRDPETDEIHFATYRVMVHDRRTAGLYIAPNSTGAIIESKYWARGQSCPVAVCFGQEPALFLVSSPFLGRKRKRKFDIAGGIRGAPVELVREEVTGLPMPATAEMAIGGQVPPPQVESRDEGPFGEWTGYYASGTTREPVIQVQALYYRHNPIILGMPPVRARHATNHVGMPAGTRYAVDKLRRMGIEGVLDVWRLSLPGVVVVQVRQAYPGHAMKAGLAAAVEHMSMGRFVVLVDEDINPRDPEDVLWAMGTRCDPETDITILTGCQSNILDPRLPPDKRERGDYTCSQAIVNACKPFHWRDQFPRTNVASPELRQQVLQKWRHLFDRTSAP